MTSSRSIGIRGDESSNINATTKVLHLPKLPEKVLLYQLWRLKTGIPTLENLIDMEDLRLQIPTQTVEEE